MNLSQTMFLVDIHSLQQVCGGDLVCGDDFAIGEKKKNNSANEKVNLPQNF